MDLNSCTDWLHGNNFCIIYFSKPVVGVNRSRYCIMISHVQVTRGAFFSLVLIQIQACAKLSGNILMQSYVPVAFVATPPLAVTCSARLQCCRNFRHVMHCSRRLSVHATIRILVAVILDTCGRHYSTCFCFRASVTIQKGWQCHVTTRLLIARAACIALCLKRMQWLRSLQQNKFDHFSPQPQRPQT